MLRGCRRLVPVETVLVCDADANECLPCGVLLKASDLFTKRQGLSLVVM